MEEGEEKEEEEVPKEGKRTEEVRTKWLERKRQKEAGGVERVRDERSNGKEERHQEGSDENTGKGKNRREANVRRTATFKAKCDSQDCSKESISGMIVELHSLVLVYIFIAHKNMHAKLFLLNK